jgi:hypothetical protein
MVCEELKSGGSLRREKPNRSFIMYNEIEDGFFSGELPEATNESVCEDIIPRLREDAFEMLGRTKVVFAPTGRIPFFRRLAPWPFLWLGCRS